MHANNQGYHSAAYNAFFNSLIYDNVCDAIFNNGTSDYNSKSIIISR